MHPVIVIEGLDGVGKSTLSERLASSLGAARLRSPPALTAAELGPLRPHFDAASAPVRRAYYRFANLVVSEQARLLRESSPVVIDRYWPSTVAFGVGTDAGSELASWLGVYPPELLVPDLVLLLEVDEAGRAARMLGRGEASTSEERLLAAAAERRSAISTAYRTFTPTVIDTSSLDADGVLAAALHRVDARSSAGSRR